MSDILRSRPDTVPNCPNERDLEVYFRLLDLLSNPDS